MCIEKLKYSLEQKKPSLLLGAGFTLGAKSEKYGDVPSARELVENLYEYCFVKHKLSKELQDDILYAKEYKESRNLKKLCSLLREEGSDRLELRDNYLHDVFAQCSVGDDDFHVYLTEYKWNKIYTLNIDDLVEYVFDKRSIDLNVWNNDNDDRNNDKSRTTLVKLHGCVNNHESGYVFDDSEYTAFMNLSNCFLRDFGNSVIEGDMIFVGTEFQEQDLWSIIERYKSDGFDISGNNYFFITPSVNDGVLKRWIERQPNVFWINWNTKQFLEFMHNEISVDMQLITELKEKRCIFLDDAKREVGPYYQSELYLGKETRYADIFENWDIEYPGLDSLVVKITSARRNLLVALYGKSYVGKSCCAKRILVDLRNDGYVCVEFEMKSSEYIQLFLEYLKSLPQDSKVAVLFEGASFYYNQLYYKLILCSLSNIKQIVIVTTENIKDHVAKRALLISKKCLLEYQIYETISPERAKLICQKFIDKNWDGRYLTKFCKNDDDMVRFVKKLNDIIDVLYSASYGKGFESHYADMLSRTNNDINKKYLYALCTLELLGVNYIPERILPGLLPVLERKFNYKKFKKEYEEILIIENHRVKVRCMRLIQKVVKLELENGDYIELLRQVVLQVTGQFREGDTNEWSELFQKALLVKRLLSEKILNIDDILHLLQMLEDDCKMYSYYWIQRGIAEQKVSNFEKADNYFRKAISINGRSYQAHHALAKNLMERGISDYASKKTMGYAPYYFDEGQKEMRSIIENDSFSRALRYSVHAYIDMYFKYLDISNGIMPENEASYIQNVIIKIPISEFDGYMKDIINKFITYCDNHGLSDYCEEIKVLNWDKLKLIESSLEDYKVENLDVICGE